MIDLVGPALRLFGRHIAGRAQHRSRHRALLHDRRRHFAAAAAGKRLRLDQFGETEIENLRVTIARDHDVVGLQIAVHDARGMRFR